MKKMSSLAVNFVFSILVLGQLSTSELRNISVKGPSPKMYTKADAAFNGHDYSIQIHPNAGQSEEQPESVCQAKLEFVSLLLEQPDNDGVCREEVFSVNGHLRILKVPELCGNNTGQHLYIPFNTETKAPLKLAIQAAQNSDWRIKVTLINCDDFTQLAPSECLQYYDTRTGRGWEAGMPGEAWSFNYGYQHLADQDYNICLSGSCSFTWEEKTGVIDVGPHTAYPFEDGCEYTDRLDVINGVYSSGTNDFTATILCGEKTQVPGMIISGSTTNPALHVYFDGDESEEMAANNDATLGRTGFKLSFQQSC